MNFRENFKKDMKKCDHHIADLRKQLASRYAAVEKVGGPGGRGGRACWRGGGLGPSRAPRAKAEASVPGGRDWGGDGGRASLQPTREDPPPPAHPS